MAWKYVQRNDETGAYRTTDQGGGGGGSSTLAGLTDVNLSSPSAGQILKYDATLQKWRNGADSFPPLIYSDEEREIGVWIDGKPLYEKTVYLGSLTSDTNWHDVNHGISGLKQVISFNGSCLDSENNSVPLTSARFYAGGTGSGIVVIATSSSIRYVNAWISGATSAYITVQYTKTTD